MPGIGSEYQIHLHRDGAGRDYMRLVVERAEGVDAKRDAELMHEIAHQIKRQVLVSTELELRAYATLPRSEKKSQRVFDERIKDDIV